MGAWAFQNVLNVGIQIVLIVFSGWCFARFRLLTAEQFMGQINVLLLRVAFPMLNIYLLGIKVDLRDAEAWRSLGAYMLWVTLVQVGILLYVWLCSGRTIGDAGLLNLVLTANNTVIVGLPVMEATFPDMGGRLSLLTAFVLFLQVIPFSITAFEVEKWMVEDHRRTTAAADMVSEPPSTPDRELSGRWVAEELPSSGRSDGGAIQHRNGDGSSSSRSEERAVEPPTPRAPSDAADGGHCSGGRGTDAIGDRTRRRQSLSRNSGSSTAGSSIGRGTVSVRGRLGRRRVGSGVVIGAVARGWAPASSLDSPTTSSLDVSTRGRASGDRQATAAALPPPSPPLPAGTSVGALGMAPGPSLDHQHAVARTPGSVALAYLDRAASAPCPIISRGSDGGGGDGRVVAARGPGSHSSTATEPSVDLPSVAPSRCPSAPASSAASVTHIASAFAFHPHLAATTASIRSTDNATAAVPGGMRSAAAVDPPAASISNGLHTAATASELAKPVVVSPPVGATTPAAGARAHLRPRHAAAVPDALPRHLDMRNMTNGRISADHCAASRLVGPVSGIVAQRLSGISGGTSGGDGGSGVVDVTAGIQRWSLPAHWPPGAAITDGCPVVAVAAAGDVYSSATAPPPPPPPPPSSGRLLSPVALACPDLPVPQAINLARPMTSALTVSTEARSSQNDYGPGRITHENLVLVGNGGGNNDFSTRASAGRQLSTAAAAAEAGAVSLSVAAAVDVPPLPPLPDRAFARAAAGSMTRRHGGLAPALGRWFKMRLTQYSRAWSITWVILKNPLLWSLLVALVINLSGLRSILWPGSSHYRPELGWVAGALSWTSGITVPVSLFSNGVWLYGKKFGKATLLQAGSILLIKLVLLGPLQLACAAACGMEATAAMSLLLLALCPVASTSFVIASQYGHGADIVTAITMLGIVLLVPVELVALALPRAFELYHYEVNPATG